MDPFLVDIEKLLGEDPYIQINSDVSRRIIQELLILSQRQDTMEKQIQTLQTRIRMLSAENNKQTESKVQCECGAMIVRSRLKSHKNSNNHRTNLLAKSTTKPL